MSDQELHKQKHVSTYVIVSKSEHAMGHVFSVTCALKQIKYICKMARDNCNALLIQGAH